MSAITTIPAIPSYFVVMIDYGLSGREAIVDPEITRRGVIGRINDGDYERDRILFIQFVHDGVAQDVTEEIFGELAPLYAEAA